MFEFLKTIIDYEIKDIEAKLSPTPGCLYGGIGEVELEVYSSGKANLECKIKHSGIPDGTEVNVVINGYIVDTLTMHGGRAQNHRTFSADAPTSLQAEVGNTVEMEINGQICYRGTFYRD